MTTEEFYGSNFAFKKTFNPISPARLLRERRYMSLIKNSFSKSFTALDIGCGRASLLSKINRFNQNTLLFGTEYNESLVNYNRKTFPNFNFSKWDLELNEVPDFGRQFDVIICQEVIEHLTPSAQIRLIKTISKLLKPSGILLLSTPCKDTLLFLKDAKNDYNEFAKKLESQPIANHLFMNELVDIITNHDFKVSYHGLIAPYLINGLITNFISIMLLLLPQRIESFIINNRILKTARFQIILARKA